MARFNGSNDTKSTRTLIQQRAKYKTQAHPENTGTGKKQIRDFNFAEYTMYGQIDTNGNPVALDSQYLRGVNYSQDAGRTISLVDFVTDMFKEFQNYFDTACRLKTIYLGDPYLSVINPVRGYESPRKSYNEYIYEQMLVFNEIYIKERRLQDKILTLEDYISHFLPFAERLGENFPLTMTGWQRSRNSNIFTSGFAIDIAGLDASEDIQKEQAFMNSPNYEFYLNAAMQTGFSVSKNSPWILVADLASPATIIYLKNYDLSSPNQIFSSRYIQTTSLDIDLLVNSLIEGYNIFVENNPYYKKITSCTNKTLSEIIYRNTTNIDIFNNTININILLSLYIDLRNIEERKPYKDSDIDRIKKNAYFYQKSIDTDSSMGYINKQYQSIYITKSGGLNDIRNRLKERKLLKKFGTVSPDMGPTTPQGGTSGGISGY